MRRQQNRINKTVLLNASNKIIIELVSVLLLLF